MASGGVAYVYDPQGNLAENLNTEMVELEKFDDDDVEWLRGILTAHHEATDSRRGAAHPGRLAATGGRFREGDAARLQARAGHSRRSNESARTWTRRSWRLPVADPSGFFWKYTHREGPARRPVPLRLRDWKRSTRSSSAMPSSIRHRAAWTRGTCSATTAARWET